MRMYNGKEKSISNERCMFVLPLVSTTVRAGLLTWNLTSPRSFAAQSSHGVDTNN